MRARLVAGNWKMHGSRAANDALLGALLQAPAVAGVGQCVCVPYPYLEQVSQRLAGSAITWGAQNLSEHTQGAFTGEVSAAMLAEFGCRHVLVGHSERRQLFGERDEQVAAKVVAAQAAGMMPILCVGETLDERESGNTEARVSAQLAAVVGRAGIDAFASIVLAYEPVWAIGTGRTATPQQAQDVHAFIRAELERHSRDISAGITILYGGSVKASNAAELFAMPDVDGGLIGGASLVAADFTAIIRAASRG